MSNDILAKELLLASFRHSVERIRLAMRGPLKIQNSRKPTDPPGFGSEIVGLCGQGGRHPYFRLRRYALEDAMDRIEQLGKGPIERDLEELSGICQTLRQQTSFDSQTGCVNDDLPAMVPLLPPEEIWHDNREMPLDIWRLISFEFDLISASVAAQTSVQDFAFTSLSPEALAFRYMIKQLGRQQVSFKVTPKSLSPAWATRLPAPRRISVSLARLFFEAGSLLTPLAQDEFAKWFTGFRYTHWVSAVAADFRVRAQFKQDTIDSRYRGIFAEEMAIGLMAVVLADCFGANPISNTSEVLPRSQRPAKQPIADFIARAHTPTTGSIATIIAESKGSLGTHVAKARAKHAKDQVRATNARISGASDRLPLAFCSSIFFENEPDYTNCLVEDPPVEGEGDSIEIDLATAFRTAFAQTFRFVGMNAVSNQVGRGEGASNLRSFDWNVEQRSDERDELRHHRAQLARRLFHAELVADMGDCAISVEREVFGVLREGIRQSDQMEKLSQYLADRHTTPWREELEKDVSSFETSLGVGCVYYSDLERAQ